MFKLKHKPEFYKTCYSEYLLEKYSKNFFNFGIDIGASGISHKWHINHMGKDNPLTKFIGFEPEKKHFDLIEKECDSLENVILHKQFFGKEITLEQVLKNHNLNVNGKWFVSCDCEGDEKYLFSNKKDLELLKMASHIAFEIHPILAGKSYGKFLEIFKKDFGDTHKIIRTFHGGNEFARDARNNSCFVLIKNGLYLEELKEIVEYLKLNPHSDMHRIKEFN